MPDTLTDPVLPQMPTAGLPQPHILVVTELDGKLWFKIECPGVSDDCRAWAECHDDRCDHDALDKAVDDGDDEPELHGVRHRYIGDAFVGWGTSTDDCWPATVGGAYDAAQEIRADWRPGRYPVRHSADDFGETLVLTLVADDVAGGGVRKTTPSTAATACTPPSMGCG